MDDTDRGPAREVAPTSGGEGRQSERPTPKDGPVPRRPGRAIAAAERDRLLKDARNVDFPAGVRGYQRAAVDRYVERVNRLITELEMYSSPESAVKHALDDVSEETRDILQHAHHSAEEITIRARARADEQLQQAEGEAQETLAAAEQQAAQTRESAQRDAAQQRETAERELAELRETTSRELEELRAGARRESEQLLDDARRDARETLQDAEIRAADLARSAELIWRERKRLLEDVHAVGEQLVTLGDAEAKRFAALPSDLSPGDQHAAHGQRTGTNGEPAGAAQ